METRILHGSNKLFEIEDIESMFAVKFFPNWPTEENMLTDGHRALDKGCSQYLYSHVLEHIVVRWAKPLPVLA